jgi:two-component system LytT family sensor kinase
VPVVTSDYIKFLKRGALLYHCFFWAGLYLLWVVAFHRYSFSVTKTMTIEFCYLIFITADYYAINNFIIPRYLLKRRYVLFVTAGLVVVTISAWLRALVAVQMNRHVFHPATVTDFSTLYLNSVTNITLWLLLIITGKMILDTIQTQQKLDVLEKERMQNELNYLKAQINPHALFNSLNTIYGHIDRSNQVARNILLQYSELLRYQLYECGAPKLSLEKEIGYIKNYVAFQRLRKDEKLIVNLWMDDIETSLEIAPLLLEVLIENAFKYVSTFSEKENEITIKLFTMRGILYGSVTNTTDWQQEAVYNHVNSTGIGMVNLKRRLELLYPQKHQLIKKVGTDFYEANLIIDLS